MGWLSKQVSLYNNCVYDLEGESRAIGDVLLLDVMDDWEKIINLRAFKRKHPEDTEGLKKRKKRLQCFTPAGHIASRQAGRDWVVSRSGLLQLDFDEKSIRDFDIEELKQAVFKLPFIAFCGLSCSGDGFYALALIAEPKRHADYVLHLWEIFSAYGIEVDRSNGANVKDVRFLSYDPKHLIKNDRDLDTLKVSDFVKPVSSRVNVYGGPANVIDRDVRIKSILKKLAGELSSPRNEHIAKLAYDLGGFEDPELLETMKKTISNNPVFVDDVDRYLADAERQFNAGALKPHDNGSENTTAHADFG